MHLTMGDLSLRRNPVELGQVWLSIMYKLSLFLFNIVIFITEDIYKASFWQISNKFSIHIS